jgi:hypothetical protein
MGEGPAHPYYPRVDSATIRSLRTPLRLILIGGLIVFLDLTYGESTSTGTGRPSGWQVDFVHDSIGYACLILAYGRLNRTATPATTRRFIPAMGAGAALGAVVSLCGCLVGWPSGLWSALEALCSVVSALATLALIWTLGQICASAGAQDLARAWKHAFIAVGALWAAPISILSLVSLLLTLAGTSPVRIDISAPSPMLALLVVLALPLVWFGAAWYKTFKWAPPGPITNCHICGYPLAGIPEPTCPECGTAFASQRPPA